MNIFKHEFKANFKSLLIWSGIVALFVTVGFTKFSAYADNPEMLAVLDSMPPALLSAFNFNAFNLTTVTGFFGIMFVYFALLLSIAAAMWGSDIITKEERDKTVEFALTLPVTRAKLVWAKTAAALVNCVVLLLVTLGVTVAVSSSYQPDDAFYNYVLRSTLALLLMQLIFLAVGILLGCALKQHKRAGSIAVSVLLGTYFLSVFAGLHENLAFLKYLTPFKYYDPALILRDARLDAGFVALSAVIIVACLVGAQAAYARRDLYI